VERRVQVPLVDLRLFRNAVLVGATLVILIVAGAINGLMFVISLFFQDPAGYGMSPLQAGLATLPAAAGMVVIAPFVSDLAVRLGARQVIALGFVVTTAGFGALTFLTTSWGYGMFVIPLVVLAVGMGLSNGCASSAATESVPQNEVGAASGISNMARYVGAALLVAAAATVYGSAAAGADVPAAEALVEGVRRSALLMTILSALGVLLALFYGRHRPARVRGVDQRATAAAGVAHTVAAPSAARD
jgi:MFS family permease